MQQAVLLSRLNGMVRNMDAQVCTKKRCDEQIPSPECSTVCICRKEETRIRRSHNERMMSLLIRFVARYMKLQHLANDGAVFLLQAETLEP